MWLAKKSPSTSRWRPTPSPEPPLKASPRRRRQCPGPIRGTVASARQFRLTAVTRATDAQSGSGSAPVPIARPCSANSLQQPCRHRLLVEVTSCYSQHLLDCIVSSSFQRTSVQGAEHREASPGKTFVAVGKGVVAGNSIRVLFESNAGSIPVTASAMTSASARVRYLTERAGRGSPCPFR